MYGCCAGRGRAIRTISSISFAITRRRQMNVTNNDNSNGDALLELVTVLRGAASNALQLFNRSVSRVRGRARVCHSLRVVFRGPLTIVPPQVGLRSFLLRPCVGCNLVSVTRTGSSVHG